MRSYLLGHLAHPRPRHRDLTYRADAWPCRLEGQDRLIRGKEQAKRLYDLAMIAKLMSAHAIFDLMEDARARATHPVDLSMRVARIPLCVKGTLIPIAPPD